MPQPTSPASVRMVQYCPFCQRLLMPMAQPFLNCRGREMVRGNGSLMASLLEERAASSYSRLPRHQPTCKDCPLTEPISRGAGADQTVTEPATTQASKAAIVTSKK